MRTALSSGYSSFSTSLHNSTLSLMKQLRSATVANKNHPKKHQVQIVAHAVLLVNGGCWKLASQFVRGEYFRSVGDRHLLGELAEIIRVRLGEARRWEAGVLGECVRFLEDVRYEPRLEEHRGVYERVLGAVEGGEGVPDALPYLLKLEPAIFLQKKQRIQQALASRLTQPRSPRVHPLIISGLMTDFWSAPTLDSLQPLLGSTPHLAKYLHFHNLSVPTLIVPAACPSTQSQTQHRLGLLLRDLGYILKQNQYINGMQVDYLLLDRIVVQYNGTHHYRINPVQTGALELRMYDRWRQEGLKKRGFRVVEVDYQGYGCLQGEKEQKEYLVRRVEGAMLAMWADGKEKERQKSKRISNKQ